MSDYPYREGHAKSHGSGGWFVPALPSWLFEDEASDNEPTFDEAGNHIVTFKLFAKIPVTYHNPGGKDIFGKPPNSYSITMADGSVVDIDAPTIGTEIALKIRRVKGVKAIDAYF